MTVTEGDNLEMLSGLPLPTHVFIGGSGPELTELLARIAMLDGIVAIEEV